MKQITRREWIMLAVVLTFGSMVWLDDSIKRWTADEAAREMRKTRERDDAQRKGMGDKFNIPKR